MVKVLHFLLSPISKNGVTPFGAVIDGGDVASIRETAKVLACDIHGHTCNNILNNAIRLALIFDVSKTVQFFFHVD